MIDYLQIWVTNKTTIKKLWNNPILYLKNNFEQLSKETGEYYNKQVKEFESITFKLEPHHPKHPDEGNERLVIGFKPHYWYNNDTHNANDFTAQKSIETIKKFISTFNITEFKNYPINNIEYGLNFILNGFGKEFIGYNIYHSRNLFVQDSQLQYSKRAHSYNRNGKANTYSYAKLYAKGFQFPEYCPKDTLRFELGSKRRNYIKKLGIFNIGSLLNINVYCKLKAKILKNIGKSLIIDQNPTLNGLNKREENRLTKYSNSIFWFNELQNERRASFNEKKKSYFALLDKTGFNLNKEFHKCIKTKLEILSPKNRKDSAPHLKSENRKDYTLDKGVLLTDTKPKICPVTTVDISMQKPTSRMLSNTGLKHLEKTDISKFNKLKSVLLTGHSNKYEKTLYDRLSKQIRNRYYNNWQRFSPNQISLF